MRAKLFVFLALVLAGSSRGQSEGEVFLSPFSVTAAADNLPAVTIKRRADYVSVPLTITCNVADAALRIAEYRAAVSSILEQVKKTANLRVLNGEFSLSAANHGGSLFKSSRGDMESNVTIYVLGSITDVNSVFDRATEVKAVVDGLKLSKQMKVTLGQTSLGIAEPEQCRAELIRLIAADLKMVTSALGEKFVVTLRGMDGRVQVRQVDEQNVRLYIAYSYAQFLVGSPEFAKAVQ